MASILEEAEAQALKELGEEPKTIAQQAEEQSDIELQKPSAEIKRTVEPIAPTEPTEPTEDFFESAEKFLEPAAPAQKSNADIFLGLVSSKRAGEIDESDKEFFNALGDEDQYKVAQARKDIPLDDAQARRIFEVEKSKMPSVPTSWEDWYNLGGDAFDVVKNVAKLGVKVPLGAAEFGRDVVKATDMTVSDEEAANNIKKAKSSFYSFMAPAFEIPENVAWATQKASEGGFGWADAAGEKLGLVNPEDRFERWKGRRLVSQAQAEYFREHPTVYSRMLDNPLAKDALSYIAKSQMESPEELAARDNISVEEAKAQQDAMAREQIDNLTSDMESELPEENARVRIAGEFLLPGELGMGTMGVVSAVAKAGTGVAKGLKYIGKSADEIAEINKAAQALRKSQFAEMLKKRIERAEAVAQGAGKIEKAIEGWKPAAEKVNKVFGNITAPVLGGIAGYSVSQESPTTGILTGILGGAATRGLLKGTKVGLEIPTFVREVAEARKVAPLGKTFETLGKSAEGSALKAKILSRGGKTIDNILSNSVEYAKTGIHGTTLALATGALESADPEEMKQMLADGLAITLGGRALQHIKGKMMGGDPIIAQRERISDDSRIHRRYQEADPETQSNLDQISDFDNAIAAKQTKLNESESDLANLMAAYKGSAEDAKKIKLAQSMVEANKMALDHVKRANVQTRNEFGREFLKTYANLQDITNGVLKTGQNNVGFNILSTDQIYQKLRNDPANNNVPDADLVQMASQAGFYSNPAQQGLVFDRRKPSIVINADSIRERIKLFGESPTEALNHETSHFIDLVPEFQSALSPVRSMLFQNEIRDAAGNIKATTPGIFSKAKLVELFNDGYLRHLDPQGKEAFTKLNKLWDESRGQLDENKVANYMKSELMADLLGEVSSRHLSKDLDSATLAMWDRARIKAKKNLLDRAIDRFYGFGGRGDIVTAANTRAEFPPEAMAAARDAMRQIVALNAEISPPAQQADMPAISKAQMMKNSALLNRFGKDSPLFKSEFKVKVFDKDGNQIGESMPVTTPNPREGTFQSTDVGMKKLSGYGDIPVEAQGLQVPDGGTLVVARDLVMQPDGVTPVMYDAKEAKKADADRKKLITEALDTDDYGTPNRFEPVAEGSETYRGTFTPAQIKAIQDMPESLVPKTLKENMLKVNEAIARGDGTRFIVDYAAVMNDNGKYQAFSPKMYDLVPIGMHLSKAGNFLVTTISVGRIFDKMRLWNERMPGRLRFWDNNLERTFDDFTKYLNNWQQGKAGETGLDADPQVALQKKNIFNDLLSLYDKATEYTNVDRTTIPRRKGDPRNKDANRTIMSIRVDHIAELLANENATKLPVNYGFAKINFMPERMEGEVPRQEKRQIDENVKFANPPSEKSAIDALSSNKREYFGMHRGLDDGYPVGIRIDIPAFTSKGVYVVTVHEKKKGGERGQVGERIGYDTIAKVDNPIFFSNEVGAKKIKSGEANKFPVATVEGQFNSSREIPEDINEWTPVGYNPREHSYFYDKTNDEPVLSGDKAISVGNTVFVKNPVYGDKANFAFMPERPIEERFPTPERGFYSGLQQTIDQKVQGKFASPDQLKAIISNPQNVKAEELKWSGVINEIDRLSAENQGKVPKDKVMDYLRNEGAVKFEEATLGENTEANKIAQKFGIEIQKEYEETTFVDKDGDEMDFEDLPKALQNALSKNIPPKYEKYQLFGGENYREVVMTMPSQKGVQILKDGKVVWEDNEITPTGKQISDLKYQYPESKGYSVVGKGSEQYFSSHFPEVPNYVAHMRLNERTDAEGNEGLFIEELQSDRHQAGREKGYRDDARLAELQKDVESTPENPWGQIANPAFAEQTKAMEGIPDAPFRKDWGVQLFKRALRDAVESGKSWIGWTTGDTQAERYDLSKQIGKVVWNEDTKMLTAYDPSQNRTVIQESNITSDKLADYVGKEVAQKLVEKSPDEDMDREISGLDLKIGGEGMKGFYDQILPKEIGKYVSKMGGKVEKSEIDTEKSRLGAGNTPTLGEMAESVGMPVEDFANYFINLPREQQQQIIDKTKVVKTEQTPIWKVNITPEMAGKVKGGQLQFMPQRPAEQERIVAATYTDPRTGEVREGINHKAANPNAPDEQTDRESRYYGFKTDTGRVVDREEAYRIAEESGQLKEATSEEDKFNADRGVLHSNMVEMEPTISDKPQSSEMIGGMQFMPQRPVGKTEPLPDFETTIIKGVTPRKGFNWKKATNVEFDIGGGKKMSFSYDPQLLTEPVFKDLIKELKGQPVILLEADRQRATGGDMGGPLHPFLKSNQVTITGPDGKKYKAVWANMTSGFVSGAKNRLASHGAKYALVHLMDPIAHKSNKRTARTLDKMMRDANLDENQKQIISIAMQGGIIAGEKAALSASITAAKRGLTGATKEDLLEINKQIDDLTKERDALTPQGIYAEIFDSITKIKTALSNLKTGRWKQSSVDKAVNNLKLLSKTKEYNQLLNKNNSLYISDNIGDTFSDRGSAIGSILSFKFGKFDPSYVMRESSDFKEGQNLDIVTAVELSQNPDIFALYFGNDPKEEAAMSTAERKARDEMRANPDFVEHEAYDWVMLGPEKGNNFLVEKPVQPEQIFKKYRDVHEKESVKGGSEETVAGAMRKFAGIKLIVDEDAVKVNASTKSKK